MEQKENTNFRGFIFLVEFWLALFFTTPVYSLEIGVSATVDKTQATLEDSILFSLKIKGIQNGPEPQLPALTDFRVQSAGTTSSMQIINGQMSVSMIHNYRLTPKRSGNLTIGPAKFIVKGDVYKSEPINIMIQQVSSGRPYQDAAAFVETSVSNLKPYIGEQVTMSFKLYRRVDVQNINLQISHDHFRKEELGEAREYNEVVNGQNYEVYELSVALFPTRFGPVKINPAVVDIDLLYRQKRLRGPFDSLFNDPFFGRRATVQHKTLRSDPIEMDVRSLPEKGRPKNFSGLVGRYKFIATLGKHSLEVGDTTTLTLLVEGEGNIQDVELFAPKVQDKFKVYPDQPQVEKSVIDNRISGKKIFKFALVPLKKGKMTIPSMSLSFFDPKDQRYVVLTSKPLQLEIMPAENAERLKVVGSNGHQNMPGNVQVLGRDILPIHILIGDFRDQGSNGLLFNLTGFFSPVLLFMGFVLYRNYQKRLRDDVAFCRTQRAYKQARKKLDQLSIASDPKDYSAKLSQIMREYIGDKLNLHGTAFTATEMGVKLKEKQYSEAKILSAFKLLEKFETYQYAKIQNTHFDELIDESLKVLKQLENQS